MLTVILVVMSVAPGAESKVERHIMKNYESCLDAAVVGTKSTKS